MLTLDPFGSEAGRIALVQRPSMHVKPDACFSCIALELDAGSASTFVAAQLLRLRSRKQAKSVAEFNSAGWNQNRSYKINEKKVTR